MERLSCSLAVALFPVAVLVSSLLLPGWLWFAAHSVLEMKVLQRREIRECII